MNIKSNFMIICERAFLAAGSNNLNLINIFSAINAPKLPCTYPQFSLVVNFETDRAGSSTLHTTILDPSGMEVARTDLPVTTTIGNMQVIAHFENMQFAMSGMYTINASLDGQPLGQRALQINAAHPPVGQKTNLA